MNNTLKDISVTISDLLKEDNQFYGYFLIDVDRGLSDEIKTACVALDKKFNKLYLLINPTFWSTLSDLQKSGILKHEVLHIILDHFQYTKEKYPDEESLNIACDLVVNQMIPRIELPDTAYYLDTFSELNLLPNKGVDYYYKKIVNLTGDSSTDEQLKNKKEDYQFYNHKWKDVTDLSSDEKQEIKEDVKIKCNIIKDKYEIGNLDNILETIVKNTSTYKPLSWKKILRQFWSSSKKTYIKSTRRKRSKRYPLQEGKKIKVKQNILVAVDTSGTMSDEMIADVFNEIDEMYKSKCVITILEADTTIKKEYVYKGVRPKKISGRGGTSFDYVIEECNKRKLDGVIYMTDGLAYAPEKKCKHKLLWIIPKKFKDITNHLKEKKIYV